MSERDLLNDIRLQASRLGARLFRNNIGAYEDRFGRLIRYGVCHPGGSDLIGWIPVKITADMVGTTLARFVAIEGKTGRTVTTDAQAAFLEAVRGAGGVAVVARSAPEAVERLQGASLFGVPST